MARTINSSDTYSERLLKHIPSEVIGGFLAAMGLLAAAEGTLRDVLIWVVFGLSLVATPLWLIYKMEVKTVWQNTLSVIAFIFWAMTVPGGPFQSLYDGFGMIGSLGILLFSALIAPIVAGFAAGD